jgi:hypothetical protein
MLTASFIVTPPAGYTKNVYSVSNNTTTDNLSLSSLYPNSLSLSASYNSVKSYVWNDGTGNLVYGLENPTFMYSASGTYTISVTATDYFDQQDTKSYTINVNSGVNASFTIQPSSAGYTFGSVFSAVNNSATDTYITQYIWDFGYGNLIYNNSSPAFTYQYPGTYNISLTAIDSLNNISVASTPVTVTSLYGDYVTFTQIPDQFVGPGEITDIPFTVSVITNNPNQNLLIDLFADNSPSVPYQFIPNKWSPINSTWKFLDSNLNFITTLSVTPVPVYYNNTVVATSGTASFYFIDSASTGTPGYNDPVIITATLQTQNFNNLLDSSIYPYKSFANNETVKAGLIWYVNDLFPTSLKVTGNYFDDINSIQLSGIKIPALITCHADRSVLIPGAPSNLSEVIFSYPDSNTTGYRNTVNLSLTGIGSNYVVNEAPLYFQNKDSNGYRSGGYILTTVTPLVTTNATTLVAQTTTYSSALDNNNTNAFKYPLGYAPNPFLWVSNPEQNTLNKVLLLPYSDNSNTINYFKGKHVLVDGIVQETNVPVLTTTSNTNYTLSGFSGIYGMAIDPRNYELIACDSELDCIYKFSSNGTLLSTYNFRTLSSYDVQAFTPSYISLDSNYNFWVTLYDSLSVLKFDKNFNLLFATIPQTTTINNYITASNTLYSSVCSNVQNIDLEYLENTLLKPPVVETDKINNCWVTYSTPLCSMLVYYTSAGNVQQQIVLPPYSMPMDIAIDANNNVWVSNTYNTLSATGSLLQYSGTTFTLLTSVTGIPRPGYISLDRDNNLWFTHSIRGIGYYNTITTELDLWDTTSVGGNAHITLTYGPGLEQTYNPPVVIDPTEANEQELSIIQNIYQEDEVWGGMSIDVYNRLWLIDSTTNYAWVLSATPNITEARTLQIQPKNLLGYYPDLNTAQTITQSIPGAIYKSAQATGDWTGNKWYQKYYKPSTLNRVISGASVPFTIKPFNNNYSIRRVNESFNNALYLNNLALPENLNSNTFLFNNFLAAVVGTGASTNYQDIGQTVYERIANFVDNHSDIDTCNVDQILNLASMLDFSAKTFSAAYPAEIRNFLDIASIPRHKLWGVLDNIPQYYLDQTAIYTNPAIPVTAGTKVVLLNKFDSTINTIELPTLNGLTTYPLSSLSIPTYISPIFANYIVYQYNPTYSGKYLDNIIDWNSSYTLMQPSLSSIDNWYGDNGIIEQTFRYLLTKNLLIK